MVESFQSIFPLEDTKAPLPLQYLRQAFHRFSLHGLLDIESFKSLIDFVRIVDKVEIPIKDHVACDVYMELFGLIQVNESCFVANFNSYWANRWAIYIFSSTTSIRSEESSDKLHNAKLGELFDLSELRKHRQLFLACDKMRFGRLKPSDAPRGVNCNLLTPRVIAWCDFIMSKPALDN